MKLLLDFVPLILFFITYKVTASHAPEAASLANQHLGFMVGGGVDQDQAPVLWATVVAIVATAMQVGLMLLRRRAVGPALWMSFAVITVMGGLTIWLRSEIFIKWKPTILYLVFAAVLLLGRWLWQRNLLRSLLGKEVTLPEPVWERLLAAWILFFVTVAGLNLFVAYSFATPIWVNFKVFGLIALTIIFILGQGFYMARFMTDDAPTQTAGAGDSAVAPSLTPATRDHRLERTD